MQIQYEKPVITEEKIKYMDVLTASGEENLKNVTENAYVTALSLF